MASDSATPVPDVPGVVPAVEPAAVPAAVVPTPTPPPEPAPPPAPPAAPVHDPVILAEARDLGISPETAQAMSPAELVRATLLLAKQRAGQGTATKVQDAPAPEPDYALPPALKAKLADMDPALVEAIEHTGRAAAERAKRAEAEVAQVRSQAAGQAFASRVAGEMTKLPGLGTGPVAEGTPEFWKREAVFNQLRVLGQSGVIGNATPPEVAVPMAYKMLFGESAAPKPASPPPPPAPTPTPKPTNRIAAPTEGRTAREILLEIYGNKNQQWDDEDAARESANGKFMP